MKKKLPSKVCPKCKRNFNWRKKWSLNWEYVKYCSNTCKNNKNKKIQF